MAKRLVSKAKGVLVTLDLAIKNEPWGLVLNRSLGNKWTSLTLTL